MILLWISWALSLHPFSLKFSSSCPMAGAADSFHPSTARWLWNAEKKSAHFRPADWQGNRCLKIWIAIGMDRNGITALMNSVLKIDMRQYPCGTCLDIMLHPTSVRGNEGLEILMSLIRNFIAHGGSGIQFNIFDAAVLRDAQANPEKYTNLQVRVCGWNVRFIHLTPEAQETFIRQAEAMS
jgi:hypothetical protein